MVLFPDPKNTKTIGRKPCHCQSCDQSLHKLHNKYLPSLFSTFASNVGKRSTLTESPGSEKRDMLYCNENDVCFSKVSFHLTPILLCKRSFRSLRTSGSSALNWEASLIFFVIIAQSRSELFFNAVPFAMDPPYKYMAGMWSLMIAFLSLSCYIYI